MKAMVQDLSGELKPSPVELRLTDFEGPLDLLLTLIEQHRIDIMNIPIAELTRQYMSYLDNLEALDVDLASAFLVTAADLLRLKSRMLMPKAASEDDDSEDPRSELVFQLLAYRRTRHTAMHLRIAAATHRYMAYHLPSSAEDLGIEVTHPDYSEELSEHFDVDRFHRVRQRLAKRNEMRYQDVADKLRVLTGRERISLKQRIIETFEAIVRRGKCFFADLFPRSESRTSRVNGFLAILELVRQKRVDAIQVTPDADIQLVLDHSADQKGYRTLTESIEEDYS